MHLFYCLLPHHCWLNALGSSAAFEDAVKSIPSMLVTHLTVFIHRKAIPVGITPNILTRFYPLLSQIQYQNARLIQAVFLKAAQVPLTAMQTSATFRIYPMDTTMFAIIHLSTQQSMFQNNYLE